MAQHMMQLATIAAFPDNKNSRKSGARDMAGNVAGDLAGWLQGQHLSRQVFRSHDALRAGGLELAYNVQDQLIALRTAVSGQTIAGYKIGVTTPRMQQMVGLDHPIAGALLSGGVMASPARVNSAAYVRLGLECEVAVRLGIPLDGRACAPSREQAAASISEVAAAFEIIEDRAADYKALDMPGLVADNSWNAGVILGEPRPLPDLADLKGRLRVNGEAADSGSTKDVLGHPLNSLIWLCEHLGRRNARIEAGQWIMTGSIVPTRFPATGDVYHFEIDGLPAVQTTVG